MLLCTQLALKALPEFSSSITIIENTTSKLFKLMVEGSELGVEIGDVSFDLSLLATQLNWQPIESPRFLRIILRIKSDI